MAGLRAPRGETGPCSGNSEPLEIFCPLTWSLCRWGVLRCVLVGLVGWLGFPAWSGLFLGFWKVELSCQPPGVLCACWYYHRLGSFPWIKPGSGTIGSTQQRADLSSLDVSGAEIVGICIRAWHWDLPQPSENQSPRWLSPPRQWSATTLTTSRFSSHLNLMPLHLHPFSPCSLCACPILGVQCPCLRPINGRRSNAQSRSQQSEEDGPWAGFFFVFFYLTFVVFLRS